MLQSVITSLIRTAAGYLVGWLLSLAAAGPILDALHINSDTAQAQLIALFVFGFGTVYYLIVRVVEEKFPQFGVLLGVPSKPVYGVAEPVPETGDLDPSQDINALVSAGAETSADASTHPTVAAPPA